MDEKIARLKEIFEDIGVEDIANVLTKKVNGDVDLAVEHLISWQSVKKASNIDNFIKIKLKNNKRSKVGKIDRVINSKAINQKTIKYILDDESSRDNKLSNSNKNEIVEVIDLDEELSVDISKSYKNDPRSKAKTIDKFEAINKWNKILEKKTKIDKSNDNSNIKANSISFPYLTKSIKEDPHEDDNKENLNETQSALEGSSKNEVELASRNLAFNQGRTTRQSSSSLSTLSLVRRIDTAEKWKEILNTKAENETDSNRLAGNQGGVVSKSSSSLSTASLVKRINAVEKWEGVLSSKPKYEELEDIQKQFETMNTWSDLLKAKELKNESLKKIRQRNPVLYIHNFELLKRYLPTTSVHNRFLDKQLALSLFYKLKEDSLQWNTYSMYLFEKKVESPHKTHSYYINDDSFPDGQYYFNGNKVSKPTPYFDFLKLASELVTGFVNEQRIKREEHSLDLGSNHTWQANYAVTNIYETGKNSVGWHTDRLTYLGPRPIIASLSLGPTREFRLRKMGPDSNQTICSIPLRHNTLLIMWAPTQEEYKHCVPPQPTLTPYPDDNTARINITFRYFPEAFGPKNTPFCYCKVPCDLRVINKDPKQFGKYYFKCISEEGTGKKGCGYFKFVEFPDYPASYFNIDMLD